MRNDICAELRAEQLSTSATIRPRFLAAPSLVQTVVRPLRSPFGYSTAAVLSPWLFGDSWVLSRTHLGDGQADSRLLAGRQPSREPESFRRLSAGRHPGPPG
jgi:hypothetical protein